jgi:hypothetical protein
MVVLINLAIAAGLAYLAVVTGRHALALFRTWRSFSEPYRGPRDAHESESIRAVRAQSRRFLAATAIWTIWALLLAFGALLFAATAPAFGGM